MKFPLLVHASPSTHRKGPDVLLRAGKWRVDSNHKDSQLLLYVDGAPRAIDCVVEVENMVVVYAEVTTPGRERELNVYLVRC